MKVLNLGNDYALQHELKEQKNDRASSATVKTVAKPEEKKVPVNSAKATEKKEEKKEDKAETKANKA